MPCLVMIGVQPAATVTAATSRTFLTVSPPRCEPPQTSRRVLDAGELVPGLDPLCGHQVKGRYGVPYGPGVKGSDAVTALA
jgi:hypothetical protein